MKYKISNIQFIPIKPNAGLIGFASCEINNQYYLGSLGVYSILDKPGSYRITYPRIKLISGELVKTFFPISNELDQAISSAISNHIAQLMGSIEKGGEKSE